MILPTAEGSGTVVLSAPASSSKDEMTIGDLYVIDGIDAVATLVPEEDVWHFEITETMHIRGPDAEQRPRINCGCGPWGSQRDRSHWGYESRTGEKLDLEEVRKGRANEVRELDELEVKNGGRWVRNSIDTG